ncbi:MAG: hypothetical protein ACJ796_11275 [Gemmatimonadaceae bacterium]
MGYNGDRFRAAVAAHRSGADVLRSLGFLPDGHSYYSLRLRLKRLALDTSHWISVNSARDPQSRAPRRTDPGPQGNPSFTGLTGRALKR